MNKTVNEVLAMPEQDDWLYEKGPALSSGGFAMHLYRAAGLFDEDIEFNANEFLPKDVYQLAIWNSTFERPEQCVQADPHLNFCQLIGDFRIELPGYNTLKPYSNMNERCESIPTAYKRTEGC